jgi:predicted DNA-binding protein
MRKLIDIPDEIVEDLKVSAVKNKKSFKKYLEALIEQEVNEVETLSDAIKNDDQLIRSIGNYLIETYEEVKDINTIWLDKGGAGFNSKKDFLNTVIWICKEIKHLKL